MLSMAACLLSAVISGPGDGPGRTVVEVPFCEVTLIRHAHIPARQSGVLMAIDVAEGTMVKEDQVVARVDDAEAQLRRVAAQREYEAAAEQAREDVEAQAARAAAAVAEAEVADSEFVNLRSPGAVPPTELRRQRLTAERAALQVKVAEMEFSVAGLTSRAQEAKVAVIDHEIKTRQITAPFAGMVVERLRQPGEWVQAGDPVLRVVQMDRLRVQGFLRADLFAPHEIEGRPVTIKVLLPGDKKYEWKATVSYVSQVLEASDEYRVWADIDNVEVERRGDRVFWLINPGMKATMEIDVTSLNQ